FFFSSRRRHTRCLSDWSSDVCSSDLVVQIVSHTRQLPVVERAGIHLIAKAASLNRQRQRHVGARHHFAGANAAHRNCPTEGGARSEERRVGKECRARWWP